LQTLKRFTLDPNGRNMRGASHERVGEYNGVRFEVWTITPQIAATWLTKVHNRPQRSHRIKKYARVMRDGRWRLNFEWIGIDPDGFVIEGQHRLEACVMAQTPFQALVLFDLSRDLFPFIGGALPRGVADNIALAGGKDYNALGGAVAFVWRADNGLPQYATGIGSRPDNDEALATLAAHPTLHDSVKMARRATRVFPSVAMLAYLHYEFKRRNSELADLFIDKLATGANMRETDPVFVLRERLLDNRAAKAKLPNKHIMALTIKAWNYAHAGRRAPKFIRWSDGAGEAFPKIS
jgi:hypothetical protein